MALKLNKDHMTLLEGSYDKARDGLQHAANELYKVQDLQKALDADSHATQLKDAKQYVAKVGPYDEASTPEWIRKIRELIWKGAGGMGGKDVNKLALDRIGDWLVRAVELRYNMADDSVRTAFAQFCLACQTQGFTDKDKSGTTIGDHTRGGGKTAMGAGL